MPGPSARAVRGAAAILKSGGLVAFPTETVYGLGARLFSRKAVRRIFAVKGRPADNPLIVHICDMKQLKRVAKGVPAPALALMRRFWPGPLTLVLKRNAGVPAEAAAGLPTVAVRMPDHPAALALLRELGEPIAAPSANRSGRPSPTRYSDVVCELGGKVDCILKDGRSKIGLESTVVDLTTSPPRILRPGAITVEALRKSVPDLVLRHRRFLGHAAPSPGMKHRHYRPHCDVVMVPPEEWRRTLARQLQQGGRIGLLTHTRSAARRGKVVFARRSGRDVGRLAKNFYAVLFDAEKAGVETLLVETVAKKGLGLALMDRLSRASSPA